MSWSKLKAFFSDLTVESLRLLMLVSMSLLVVSLLLGHEYFFPELDSLTFQGLSIDIIFSAILVLNLHFNGKKYSTNTANRIAVLAFFILLLLIFYEGAVRYFEGTTSQIGLIWMVLLPIPTYLLLGNKEGFYWTAALIIAMLPPAIFPDHPLFESVNQPRGQILYLILGLVVVAGWFSAYQKVIEKYIEDINRRKRDYRRLSQIDKVTVNSIGQAVLITNEKEEVVKLNERVLEMLHVARKELIGLTIHKAFQFCNDKYWAIEPKDLPISEAMRTQKPHEAHMNIVLKDGRLITVLFSASPLVFEGKSIGTVVTLRDISEEVERKRARAGFLQLTTHELRTPLSTIRWYLEYVLDGEIGKLTKGQHEYILEAQQASMRMTALIDELLKISQLDVGLFSIESVPINIKNIIDEVVRDEKLAIEVKKIKVKIKIVGEHGSLKQDPNLIRILLLNFLTNAIKYSPENSIIEILVEIDHSLKISFKDKGMGVPKNQQNKIFTKQFRADNAIKLIPEGNGLGLHLSKRIVTELSGKIDFESTEGKGSTFWVDLPKVAIARKNISEKEKSKAAIS